MQKLRIIIRVDGNHLIGMGHVYRSMNLANVLQKRGHEITFLTKNQEAKQILSKKYICRIFTSHLEIQKNIQRFKPNIIVLDKLDEKTSYIKLMQNNCKMIAIDYIGKNKKIIKNSINMLYQKSGARANNSFSDFKYTILNQSFLNVKNVHVKKKVKSILILQGGSDTRCFTPKIIDALNRLKEKFSITTILGPSFQCWKRLEKTVKINKKTLRTLHNVKNMREIMIKHDMAITAGGMSLLELCRSGIPSIILCGEKFENETASLLQRKGFGINLGYGMEVSEDKIARVAKQLLADYEKRIRMNMIGRKMVDGMGAMRVARIIEEIGATK